MKTYERPSCLSKYRFPSARSAGRSQLNLGVRRTKMENSRARLLFLLLPMIGCLQRSSDANLLRPLASAYSNGFSDEPIQPQYLVFADPITASVLKNLARNRSYQIAPAGTGLLCPSNPAPGRHGYLLRLRVDAVMGDSAIVAAEQRCAAIHGVISTGVHYLLRKRLGKWAIDRPLDGWSTVLGMASGRLTNVADDKHLSDAASPQWL